MSPFPYFLSSSHPVPPPNEGGIVSLLSDPKGGREQRCFFNFFFRILFVFFLLIFCIFLSFLHFFLVSATRKVKVS